MYMFIMHGIITEMHEHFFSADYVGVSGAQADGNRVRQLCSSTKPWY
jgi:hypothetical protein